MSPIQIGFVGLSTKGWAATALAPGLLSPALASTYSLRAVSTSSEQSAEASATKYTQVVGHPVKPYYGSTSSIASDPDVELVVVSVKALSHKAALLPAIEAGKNVFVEWPAGVGLAECTELADAASKKGVRSIVGLQARQSPAIRKAKEILDSGKIGKILSTSIIALVPREIGIWGPQTSESSAFTADATNCVGLLDIAVGHYMDAFTYLLGPFASINATTETLYKTATIYEDGKPTNKTVPITSADHVAFTGLLKSGAFTSATWRGGMASTPGRRQLLWEIDGEEGSLRLESNAVGAGLINIRDPQLYLNGELVEVQNTTGASDNLTSAWAEFAKGDEGHYATLEDAVRNHRLLDAIKRSAKEGKRVDLN